MRTIRVAIIVVAGALASGAASAAQQVALVENLTGNPTGIEFMDYVESGKIIRLGPRDTLVLSYISSCVRETITGGTVTVGIAQSDVEAGQVKRIKVQCHAGRMLLSGEQVSQFAGKVFRGAAPLSVAVADLDAKLTLYGASPIFELNGSGQLLIERVDRAGEREVIEVSDAHLLHRSFYDFAQWRKSLPAGGVYRALWSTQEFLFKIDARAKPGYTPVLGRLVRFAPPS
jgi:hypothetical protein